MPTDSSETIAVTAATGALGRLVIADLLRRGVTGIVAIARDAAKAADLGVEVRIASYDDPAALAEAVTGVDRLLLISGNELGRRTEQHGNVIAAAKAAGGSRIVYTSAPHADTSPIALAPEHYATEQLLDDSGVPSTVLRNNWYHENYLPQLEPVRATGELLGSAGEGVIASASRADYAVAAAEVLTSDGHDGATYELAGPAWTMPDLAATLADVLGRPVTYRDLPTDEHAAALQAAGLPEETAAFVAGMDAAIAQGALAGDPADLERLLGRPPVPLREVLAAGAAG